MPRIAVTVTCVALVALTGCTGGKDPAPEPTAAPPSATTASPTPLPTGDPKAASELVALASKAAKASYDATYDFDASNVRTRGTLRIFAAPPRFRVDIDVGPASVRFYQLPIGTVTCRVPTSAAASCDLVAKPGAAVPDAFDPGVQRLFTTGLDALSRDPAGFAITSIEGAPPAGHPSRCFRVIRLADLQPVTPGTVPPPGKGFDTGDYCFETATALLSAAHVASGSLTLQSVGDPPGDAAFTPPATPRPVQPTG
jgi:hypothetical protein